MKTAIAAAILLQFPLLFPVVSLAEVPAVIHYEGFLQTTGPPPAPVNGPRKMEFRIYDVLTGGTFLWNEVFNSVSVHDGVFKVNLTMTDPVLPFDVPYYIEILVTTVGDPFGDPLSPREALASTPYSLHAQNADNAGHANNADNAGHANNADNAGHATLADAVARPISPPIASVEIADGAVMESKLADSAVTSDKVADETILFADIGANGAVANEVIKRNAANTAWVAGLDEGAGAFLPLAGGTMTGAVTNLGDPPITMGKGNFGSGNTNTGANAFVAGANNAASASYATVGGGLTNTASNSYATVSGGVSNTASQIYSTVGGGRNNTSTSNYATVAGGTENNASQSATTVGGGMSNRASGGLATVPGGALNYADGYSSLAAGYKAKADHDGAFVWADWQGINGPDFHSTATNEFSIRASGGARVFSNAALTAGVTLAAGASSWSSVSDSTLKRNLRLVDGKSILNKLASLPIKQWSYKAQDPHIEHIGPMAQEFYEVFRLGDDNRTISTIDPSGIALAAIQQLKKENDDLRWELEQVKSGVASLSKMVRELQHVSGPVPKDLGAESVTIRAR